jgi:hypothetical protein
MGRQNHMASEKERLIAQIQKRAFRPIIPFLPKPWIELRKGDGKPVMARGSSRAMDLGKGSLRFARHGGIKAAGGKGDAIPTEKVGSLFMVISHCPPRYLKKLLKEGHRILKREGRILIGFIPRDSPWGSFYLQGKRCRWPDSYPGVWVHSLKQMEHQVMQAGFSLQGISSTLFQNPRELKAVENPMMGYHPLAGFLVLIGEKLG